MSSINLNNTVCSLPTSTFTSRIILRYVILTYHNYPVRPEVHKATNVKNAAFWEVMSCTQVKVYQHIREP